MKDKIFQVEKVQLTRLIQTLNGENTEDIIPEVERHLQIIRLVEKCEYSNESGNEMNLTEEQAADRCTIVARMCRGLRGGFLGEKKEIFVPENVIRSMRFTHGDKIQAERLSTRAYQKHYKFTLVEKGRGGFQEAEPVCLFRQPVIREPLNNLLCIYAEGQGGEQIKIPLSEQDIRKFSIEAGDQVDYAYYEDDMYNGLVRWRFSREN